MELDQIAVTDAARILVLILYGATFGLTAWICVTYTRIFAATRRLLPWHVALISLTTLGFETEAAWQNATRIGTAFTWYAPLNVVLFTMMLVALGAVQRHLNRKAAAHDEIRSLIYDPNELP